MIDNANRPIGGAVVDLETGGGSAQTVTYDVLTVTGTATLAGTVDASLPGSFAPTVGDVYSFVQAGSVSGVFSTLTGDDPSGGVDFDLQHTATTADVVAVPGT